MPATGEIVAGLAFLRDRLTTDATLTTYVGSRVYEGVAPQVDPVVVVEGPPEYPLIVIQEEDSDHVLGLGAVRIVCESEYLVRLIGTNGKAALLAPYQRIEERLFNPTPISFVLEGNTWSITSHITKPLADFDIEDGQRYDSLSMRVVLFIKGQ